jgi:hypothetical protein
MIVSLNFKDISENDLSAWKQGGGLGKMGILFYSEDIPSIDLETYEFLIKVKNKVDILILVTPPDTFSNDSLKLWAYLPFVDFVYTNSNYKDLCENIRFNTFFQVPNQTLPSELLEEIKKSEDCETVQYEDV